MSENYQKYIKPIIFLAAAIAFIQYLGVQSTKPEDIWSYISNSVAVVSAISFFYVNWGWRLNPFEKLPKLKKKYTGTLKYNYKNKPGEKPIELKIKQTLFSIKVISRTDINKSSTIIGNIVMENDEYVLYYSYRTSPDLMIKNNPIQHGTCRIILDEIKELKGCYWTDRNTTGDMLLKANN